MTGDLVAFLRARIDEDEQIARAATLSTDDLVAFLRARIDEDEQIARAATPGPWRTADVEGIFYIASAAHGPVTMDNDNPVCDWDREGVPIERDESEGGRDDAEHIARHDPARVLADVEAKRQIVDFVGALAVGDPVHGLAAKEVLRHLALLDADHPDYGRSGHCEH